MWVVGITRNTGAHLPSTKILNHRFRISRLTGRLAWRPHGINLHLQRQHSLETDIPMLATAPAIQPSTEALEKQQVMKVVSGPLLLVADLEF